MGQCVVVAVYAGAEKVGGVWGVGWGACKVSRQRQATNGPQGPNVQSKVWGREINKPRARSGIQSTMAPGRWGGARHQRQRHGRVGWRLNGRCAGRQRPRCCGCACVGMYARQRGGVSNPHHRAKQHGSTRRKHRHAKRQWVRTMGDPAACCPPPPPRLGEMSAHQSVHMMAPVNALAHHGYWHTGGDRDAA